jgi:hypothetical protein
MAAEQNPFAGGPGDVEHQLKMVENELGAKYAADFAKLDAKEARSKKRAERTQKMKNLCGSKAFKCFVGAVVAGSVIASIVTVERVEAERDHRELIQTEAEAVVSILRSPDAVRSLNLTTVELDTSQESVENKAANSDGLLAEGYKDLAQLYTGAASLAIKVHNTGPVSDDGHAAYVYEGDYGLTPVTETAQGILQVPDEVVVAIARQFSSGQ